MGSVELQPVPQTLEDCLFAPEAFQLEPRHLAEGKSTVRGSQNPKPSRGRRSGQKPLLAAEDFILPELVSHADNGDLSVHVGCSADTTQVEQVFGLAECGEESLPSFSALPFAEQ